MLPPPPPPHCAYSKSAPPNASFANGSTGSISPSLFLKVSLLVLLLRFLISSPPSPPSRLRGLYPPLLLTAFIMLLALELISRLFLRSSPEPPCGSPGLYPPALLTVLVTLFGLRLRLFLRSPLPSPPTPPLGLNEDDLGVFLLMNVRFRRSWLSSERMMWCSPEMPLLDLTKGALFSMAWELEDEVIDSPRGMEVERDDACTKTMAARTVNTVMIFMSAVICCLLSSGVC
ncbi:MAG: hypothetical protein JOS17DRAFT_549711 [Linnemannia elongata]|nr:MAG: hypothetical protein JOS17DRAFT_549711 [Linnemannia elongata]